MIRLFVQDRNTSNAAVQYTRNTKKRKKNQINATSEKCLNKHLSIYDTIVEFNVDSKAEYTA